MSHSGVGWKWKILVNYKLYILFFLFHIFNVTHLSRMLLAFFIFGRQLVYILWGIRGMSPIICLMINYSLTLFLMGKWRYKMKFSSHQSTTNGIGGGMKLKFHTSINAADEIIFNADWGGRRKFFLRFILVELISYSFTKCSEVCDLQ